MVERLSATRQGLRLLGLLATDRGSAQQGIERAIGVLRAIRLFRGCERGHFVNAQGYVRVVRRGDIRLGERVFFRGGMLPTELICHAGGEIVIGARTGFNYGCSIEAHRSIRIGERSLFGAMVRVRDAGRDSVAPVVIGNDVWIAHGVIIEPGVTVGDGCVVSAGSVVASNVPPHSLAVGNPATCLPLRTINRRAAV